MSTEDTNLTNKANEKAKKGGENKDFYDLDSSHFTSSNYGDVSRALENKRARLKCNCCSTQTKGRFTVYIMEIALAQLVLTRTLTKSNRHPPQAEQHLTPCFQHQLTSKETRTVRSPSLHQL